MRHRARLIGIHQGEQPGRQLKAASTAYGISPRATDRRPDQARCRPAQPVGADWPLCGARR